MLMDAKTRAATLCIAILQKPTAQRTLTDTEVLEKSMQQKQCLGDLPLEARLEMCKHATHVCLEPGQVLFNVGDFGDAFYIIVRGVVAVFVPDPKGPHTMVEVATLQSGAAFGELALLGQGRRMACIRAPPWESCDLMKFTKATFDKIMKSRVMYVSHPLHCPGPRLRLTEDGSTVPV